MDSEQPESSNAPATTGARPDRGRPIDSPEPAEEGLTGAALLEFRCVRNAAYHEETRSGNSMRDALPQGLRTNSGSLAMFAAMRLVSSAQR